jgi:hypothetical protein
MYLTPSVPPLQMESCYWSRWHTIQEYLLCCRPGLFLEKIDFARCASDPALCLAANDVERVVAE